MLRFGGAFAQDSVPALLLAARDPQETVRNAALESLAGIAWQSNVVTRWRLQAAREVLQNGSESQSWSIVESLARLQPEPADSVPLLVAALHSKSERVRARAATVLGRLGPAARPAAAELKKLSADEWLNVREQVEAALKAIEVDGP